MSSHPPLDWPDYKSTRLRHPTQLRPLTLTETELTSPRLGDRPLGEHDHDLTVHGDGEPLGERIIVYGQVLEDDGRPVPETLVEIWQANACGRYRHAGDQHPAPLDPNFEGVGRCVTDREGRYRFVTIKPGAYPWGNHPNAWRPQHIHFSVFGRAFDAAPRDADVLPRRPAVRVRPDLQLGARPAGARAHDLRLRPLHHQARLGAGLPLRHRAAGREATPFE